MKIDDFAKEEQSVINDEIEVGCSLLGQDKWDTATHALDSKMGLCSDCVYLNAAISEYGTIFAMCREFDTSLGGTDPIVECTRYSKRGQMTLNDMEKIAIIIETDKKVAGFIKE